jgi:hypothetical protein
MQNNFIPDSIEIGSRAETADNEGDHYRALSLYRESIIRFVIGYKYKKKESKKWLIIMLAERYMNRAVELKHNRQENKKQQLQARDLHRAPRQSKWTISDAAEPDASNVSSVKRGWELSTPWSSGITTWKVWYPLSRNTPWKMH